MPSCSLWRHCNVAKDFCAWPIWVELTCYLGNDTVISTLSTDRQLTHWDRVKHICVSKLIIIGSDNGLSPEWQCWNIVYWTFGYKNIIENLIAIYTFLLKKMHLKMLSGKWRPFCLGLNVLNIPMTAWPKLGIHTKLENIGNNTTKYTGSYFTVVKVCSCSPFY